MASSGLTAEIREIRDQLSRCEPFRLLPDDLLARAARGVVVRYMRTDMILLEIGKQNDSISVIVTGSAELRAEDGTLVELLGEGDAAGVLSSVSGQPIRSRCLLLEDTIIYTINGATLAELRRSDTEFDHELIAIVEHRLVLPHAESDGSTTSLMMKCRRLITRDPVTIDATASVRVAAGAMADNRVSSLIVTDQHGRPVGLMTDRDLRNRVLAADRPSSTPVSEVMTTDVTTVRADRSAHEALLAMSSRAVHHLPVIEPADGVTIGMITSTDILMARSLDPVFFVGSIVKADTVDEIVEATAKLPQMIENLLAADALAEVVGRLITGVTDAVTRRLCELAEAEAGAAPMPYAFVCFGSQARQEQSAFTDQDNALILHHDPPEGSNDEAWFEHLAAFVCDGMNAAGYRYCPGEIMATNPKWRAGIDRWERYIATWLVEPDPEAVLNASVFFDARHLHGDESLTDRYLDYARGHAGRSSLFLGQLAANAADFRPPIGFFRRFVVEKNGEHLDKIDLKRHGVTPVVELARVYALEAGIDECNTFDRLRATGRTDSLAPSDAAELAIALEHVGYFRLQHQRRQLERGEVPDNHLAPTKLSRLEQEQLRRAFVAIDRRQDFMRRRFNTSEMG